MVIINFCVNTLMWRVSTPGNDMTPNNHKCFATKNCVITLWSVHFLFVVLLFMWEQSASEKFGWKKMHHQKFKRILWYFLEGHISALINFLMFVDQKLLYWTATKQQLAVAQKGEVGDKVLWNSLSPMYSWIFVN